MCLKDGEKRRNIQGFGELTPEFQSKSLEEVGWSDYGILNKLLNGLSAVLKTGLWTGF